MSEVLKLKNVSKIFLENGKRFVALENINLSISDGEFFVLVGPSGSGKSTILRILSGLDREYQGEVTLLSGMGREDMSFVFQQFALMPWLSVEENVALPLLARGVPERERHKKVYEELKRFGLEKFAKTSPRELSGGMRQRVGIARAFITNPKIIFMDEPFSELDSFTAEKLRGELLELWAERKPTIVMVSHIVSEALELADRVAVLTPRPGRVEKVVENTLSRPRNKRSENFYALEDTLTKLIAP